MEASYPHEPGKAGIPFTEIFKSAKNGQQQGIVHSDSGRKLEYDARPDYLSITDVEFGDRVMSAKFDSGVVTFGLQTKKSDCDSSKQIPWEKHPDMFAKSFIKIALQYLKDNGNTVHTCRGIWYPDSDNFKTYYSELRLNGGNKVEAVRKTWSGSTFIELGFSKIDKKDIICISRKPESLSDEETVCVNASFHLPN